MPEAQQHLDGKLHAAPLPCPDPYIRPTPIPRPFAIARSACSGVARILSLAPRSAASREAEAERQRPRQGGSLDGGRAGWLRARGGRGLLRVRGGRGLLRVRGGRGLLLLAVPVHVPMVHAVAPANRGGLSRPDGGRGSGGGRDGHRACRGRHRRCGRKCHERFGLHGDWPDAQVRLAANDGKRGVGELSPERRGVEPRC
mmetsp:Transcript_73962/g.187076  ORF Transcript_73962/g.187076 Transcript_73962/m.187076 type:complete len:200 (-) Transcript_73962:478-1077(-)